MMVELRLDHLSGNWMLQVLKGAHNHAASTHITAYPVYRKDTLTVDICA